MNCVEGQGRARENLSVYAVNRPYLEKNRRPLCSLLWQSFAGIRALVLAAIRLRL